MPTTDPSLREVLRWCAVSLGPVEIAADRTREHPGLRAGSLCLRAAAGLYYVKIHHDPLHWASEVHAYEKWAPAFGRYAPSLIAVREEEPLALLITSLPGDVLEGVRLPARQERAAWRDAGRALAGLHNHAVGEFFGPVRRDGSCAGERITDAAAWVDAGFEDWVMRGKRVGALTEHELDVVRFARLLLPAFAGERPTPCHRDYCPANWLITPSGVWAGVIDFEFSYWDVRAADFTRYPEWSWIDHPRWIEAFFEGYGRSFTLIEQQQRLAALVLYALGAVVWGEENDYHGFAGGGRRALETVKRSMKGRYFPW